jgi:peptide deformylase
MAGSLRDVSPELYRDATAPGKPPKPRPDHGLERTDTVLYQPAEPMTREMVEHPDFHRLVRAMEQASHAWHGYALAAPQIGLPISLFVMTDHMKLRSALAIGDGSARVDWANLPHVPPVIINPTIEPIGDCTAVQEEGCLSFPGQFRSVTRPSSVRMHYTDEHWIRRMLDCHRLMARVVQHEVDHLNGVTIFPRPALAPEAPAKPAPDESINVDRACLLKTLSALDLPYSSDATVDELLDILMKAIDSKRVAPDAVVAALKSAGGTVAGEPMFMRRHRINPVSKP